MSGNSLSVIFHGVRGSTPAPGNAMARFGGNTSCVEIRTNDQILILDAGTGIRSLGDNLITAFGSRPIKASLVISHTHWDHIQGLPFFAPAYSANNHIRVFAAKGDRQKVDRGLRNQMDPTHFPVGLEHLTGIRGIEEFNSDDVTLGDFRIRVAALNHPGGCAGFRIDAAGGSVAYLPDHEPGEENLKLMEFAQGVDLLILDTQYTESEYVAHRGWGHGCLSASVQFAIGAKARELVIFHHDPSHTDFHIDQMIERGRQLAGTSGLMVSAASENRNAILFEGATPKLPSLPPFILTPANAVLPTEKVVFPVEALQPGEAAK
ncbi:MAG TPA: MBL fold metallo-hydrolase [Chthoniobacterales bacterium]|jgi:phosphoribosyl 1,2-cyclic phosphodiesterase|nr:MBL fold metallo-hydrolase [Chthoniobacterales bacterium]